MDFYKPIEELARGTFGTVYLCNKLHNNHKIIVKQIHVDMKGPELLTAKNEVAVLTSLSHPNIVRHLDNFIKNRTFHIVMEYASHGSLQEHISNERPKYFSAQYVMDFFCQILMGLDHIHEKKIIHRDLKCENIFITGLKKDIVKIGDFGIAKILTNHNKKTNTIIGTCNYLAPELCNGEPYNFKSDIWALGCILYEMCAMEKMFDGPVSKVVMSIVNNKRKTVNTKVYGQQIQEIIDSMLQMNADSRPDTCKLMTHPDIFPTMYYLGSSLGCVE